MISDNSRTGRFTPYAIALLLTSACYAQHGIATGRGSAYDALAQLPLGFEPDEQSFVARDPGVTVALSPDRARFFVNSAVAAMVIVGASPTAELHAAEPLGSVANYLIGRDRSHWRINVPQYRKVVDTGIYPGIDAMFYGNGHSLEFDLRVHAFADPGVIRLAYQGVEGLHLNESGDLVFSVDGREITQRKPVTYQASGPVSVEYVITSGAPEVTLQVGRYTRSEVLVIDPLLSYGTFFGGNGLDGANGMAVDATGNAYIAGYTRSTNLPIPSAAAQPSLAGLGDAFVAKINPSGSALVYTTYLGGSGDDQATGIAVDLSGNVSLSGVTNSTDFPTTPPPSGVSTALVSGNYAGGSSDAFVTILNSAGNGLILSGYLGGPGADVANSLTMDAAGALYVVGYTNSTSFSGVSQSSAQPFNAGGYDMFATKVLNTGQILYSTFFGGTGDDVANSVAVDQLGVFSGASIAAQAYIVGETTSPSLPSATSSHVGSGDDVMLVMLHGDGSLGAVWDIGGSSDQAAWAVAVDANQQVYMTGTTNSSNFLPANLSLVPFQSTIGGGYDAFVEVLSTVSGQVVYATYLGGAGSDEGYSIVLGQTGDVYVAGYTDSTNFLPGLPNQPRGSNTFVVELAPPAPAGNISGFDEQFVGGGFYPVFSAYLSAIPASYPQSLYPVSLAVLSTSSSESVFVAGYVDSTFSFPSGTPQLFGFAGGSSDAFVAQFSSADLSISIGMIGPYDGTNTPGNGTIVPGTSLLIPLTLLNSGPDTVAGLTVTLTLPAGLTFVRCLNAAVTCSVAGSTVTVTYGLLAVGSIAPEILATVSSTLSGMGSITATVSSATADPVSANNLFTAEFDVEGVNAFTVNLSDPVDFGQVQSGQSSSQTLTVTIGTSQSPLDIALTVMPDSNVAQNVFTANPDMFTLGSDPRNVSLTFQPTSVGADHAVLEIVSQQPPQAIILNLDGAGIAAVPPPPTITQVLDGAGFRPTIAANGWVTIKGTNFIDPSLARTWGNADFQNGQLPTVLSGVSVTINGKAAYVEYISPTQINALAPRDPQTGVVPVVIVTPLGTANASVQKDTVAPGLFQTDTGYVAATSGSSAAGIPASPAQISQILTLYLSGLGDTNPPYISGTFVNSVVNLPVKPTVLVGGQQATVDYAGMTPDAAGLYQLNLFLPKDLASGDYPVTVQLSGQSTQTPVLVSVAQ